MYRTICCELWTDPKVKALSHFEKLLFLYLITNPHSHYCGLYYLPSVMMQHEVNIGMAFEGALKGLRTPSLAYYDHEFELVLVKTMYKYQGNGRNMDKGAASHLRTLHNSSLIHQFIAYYPSVADYFEVTPFEPPSNPITSDPSPDSDSVPVSDPVPSSVPDRILDEWKKSGERDFETFWKAYPKKAGKKAALKAFQNARDRPRIDDLLESIRKAKASPQWAKDGGQFIPHPATWLNRGQWADVPTETKPSVFEEFLARGERMNLKEGG